jgi:surface protein
MGIIAGSRLRVPPINPNAFIIEVTAGYSNSKQFQFTGAVGDYDVVAKQNGTQVATFNDLSGQETITLPSSGIYVLEVSAKEVNGFNRIAFDNGGYKINITDIKQWGTIVWSSFERAFLGCENMLVTATDVPNLSSVTDMGGMFESATIANPDTSNWDVSSVTDMSFMFQLASSANPDTSNWDVSSVTDMSNMFDNATSFNNPVNNWDVSNVTNMRRIFRAATSFNNPVNNWDVSSVTDMNNLFYNATAVNPNTSNWNVSSVTDMRRMFENTNLSVQNLTDCYENWSLLTLQNNVGFSAGTTKYNSTGQSGRDILTNTYSWNITDGGQV